MLLKSMYVLLQLGPMQTISKVNLVLKQRKVGHTPSNKTKWWDSGCFMGEAAINAPDCSQFAGRSEYTLGTDAEYSVDSSRIWTQEKDSLFEHKEFLFLSYYSDIESMLLF